MVTISDRERIEVLRTRCLGRSKVQPLGEKPRYTVYPHHSPRRTLSIYLSMSQTEGMPWQQRMGLREHKILGDTRLEVDEFELLMGRLALGNLQVSHPELEAAKSYCEKLPIGKKDMPGHIPVGRTGHCQLNYDELFQVGIDGIARRIRDGMAQADAGGRIVLQSFVDSLAGLKTLIEHAADVAGLKAQKDVPKWRKDELEDMAAVCRHVASHPPRTFHEAIQLMWLTQLATMYAGGISLVVPGRIDRHLAGFYEADLAAGRITRDRALLLIESLYILINEYIPAGLAFSVMIGGRNASGEDASNGLSYLALEALRRTRLVYPTVGLCWHEGTPQDLVDLTLELISDSIANPAIFGDEVIQRGLQRYGVPPEESHDYINSTCPEITPCKSSNVWVASPYFNICGILLEEISAAAGAKSPPEDFEAFLGGFFERLSQVIGEAVEYQNTLRSQRQQYGGKPLQSVFTKDCIERCSDIDDGGARYNWVECTFIGLANLADSLYVVLEEVFRRGNQTLKQFKAMLDENFENHPAEYARIQNKHPKYGHDHKEVDALLGRVTSFLVDECGTYRMVPDDSPYVPGAFAHVQHERFGRETGATPDGRRAGFPFADGCGPAQGREKYGPTAAIRSTTSWDHSPMLGGMAFNMKFCANLFKSSASREKLKDLVLTYVKLGGFSTQVNVVSRDLLLQARAAPQQYRDLVVRIGGYTDYFTRLTPEMQDEVLLRTEYRF